MATGLGLYSRAVSVLKVGLPLVALAMLAALFLVSDDERATGDLAFSPGDLAALGQGMRVTAPVFSGVTEALDRFRFTAAAVVPDAAPPTRAVIDTLAGRIDFADGQGVDLRAETGDLDLGTQRMTLRGAVRLVTADGYSFGAEQVDVDLKVGGLTATGAIRGGGPMGRIASGRLTVSGPVNPGGARMFLFEDAVRLVYDPAAENN